MRTMPSIALRSGRRMPAIGLGTWQLTDDTAGAIADALSLGYRMIDTSGDYGTQSAIGEALHDHGVAQDVFIVTKVEEDEDAYEAARRNLGELRLERVDLLLIHRPPERGVGRALWQGLVKAMNDG